MKGGVKICIVVARIVRVALVAAVIVLFALVLVVLDSNMNCRYPIQLEVKGRQIYVPCGKCAWCLSNIRQDWFVRLKFESRTAEYRSFVTYTYDDENLPVNVDEQTGVVTPTVNLRDIQLFHMRMRKKYHFRFMVCSEYGPKTHRPHYHGVYFHNEPINFAAQWPFGRNNSQFPAKDGSFLYITKYILKGSNVPEGANPNFRTMSRRPGIGSNYELNPEYRYLLLDDAVKTRIPRYYKRKYLARLDAQLRDVWQDNTLDFLASQPLHEQFHKQYDHLVDEGSIDPSLFSFEEWLSKRYEKDFKKQITINSKENEHF